MFVTRKGIIFLVLTAIAWSWPNILIRMLRTEFDIFTQSFFRYIGACVFLFTIGLGFMRKSMIHAVGNLRILLIPAIIMFLHQIFFTAGLFKTPAVMSSLLGRLNAILIPTLSYIFYKDERTVVKNKRFILGSALAISGVVGVILGKGLTIEGEFNIGIIFVLLGTVFWSIYAVYIKKLVKTIDPLSIISYVSLISVILFLPFTIKYGDLGSISRASFRTNVLLFGSGILGIGIGNLFYYHAVKHVGTSVSSIFFLLMPFSVGILGFLILGETLTFIQVLSGLISIIGCWSVTIATSYRD
ncbi:MAG: DMT family transporter [bacterium]